VVLLPFSGLNGALDGAIYRYIPIYCNIRCYAPMYAAFRLSSERKQSSRLGLGFFLTNLVQ